MLNNLIMFCFLLLIRCMLLGFFCKHNPQLSPEPTTASPTSSAIPLEYVGNNGSPSELFPLGPCQGDCDTHAECQVCISTYRCHVSAIFPFNGFILTTCVCFVLFAIYFHYQKDGLNCMQRDNFEAVPGCVGSESDKKTDYCYVRPHNNYLWLAANDGIPASAYPLSVCDGDCDDDGDCAVGLKCFVRKVNSFKAVPGCEGVGDGGEDYCYDPNPGSTTSGPTAKPTVNPTVSAVPIAALTAVPIATPTAIPIAAPVIAPIAAPAAAPTDLLDCSSIDDWTRYIKFKKDDQTVHEGILYEAKKSGKNKDPVTWSTKAQERFNRWVSLGQCASRVPTASPVLIQCSGDRVRWDKSIAYETGHQVFYEDYLYEAVKNGKNKNPVTWSTKVNSVQNRWVNLGECYSSTPTAAPTWTTDSSDCPGPFLDYDQCENSIKRDLRRRDSAWFALRGMDGSRCSIQQYWSNPVRGQRCPPVVEEDCVGPFPDHDKCEGKILKILQTKDSAFFTVRGMDGSRCSIQQYWSNPVRGQRCPPVVEEDCVGPFPDHDKCEGKILKILQTKDSAFFTVRGMDGSRCSVQELLSTAPKTDCPSL